MRRTLRIVAMVVLVLACPALAACGASSPSATPSPTPRVAPSTTAFSPLLKGNRTIRVFLKDSLTAAQRQAMAQRIASMPEVEVYAFMTKAQALIEYKQMMGSKAAVVGSAQVLPASFRIVVKKADQARLVANRFVNDPLVDNPGGVKINGQ